LTIASVRSTIKNLPKLTILVTLTLLASVQTFATAQTKLSSATPTNPAEALPDAPGFAASDSTSADDASAVDSITNPSYADTAASGGGKHHLLYTSRRAITIQPGEIALPLAPHAKVVLGLEESFTLFSVVGWTTSAGYSHLTNGSPNYGTDSGAFGMRLGATALRNISENIFGNAILAPVLHEDPRYYKMGDGHNFFKRVIYASTRAIITRSDDGREIPNYALLGGNLAGAALTNAYYPRLNQGYRQTAQTFGTSVGGAAVGFVVTEFLDDVLTYVHLQKLE
jgi:hypothetical protein